MVDYPDPYQRYEFTVQGQGKITVDELSKTAAMAHANKMFDLGEGAWMETTEVYYKNAIGFYWSEGNYFD